MIVTAFEFSAACEAGLVLTGVDEKKPEWVGSNEQWTRFGQLINWFEQDNYKSLPWLNKSPF